jgi:hypothetical protein
MQVFDAHDHISQSLPTRNLEATGQPEGGNNWLRPTNKNSGLIRLIVRQRGNARIAHFKILLVESTHVIFRNYT